MFVPPARLGVGLVYSSFLHDLILREPGLVDYVEIEPETFWIQLAPGRWEFRLAPAELDRLRRLPCPKLLHSIGFPTGGSRAPDPAHVPLFNRMAQVLDSPWVSEHLSFNTAALDGEVVRTGMLLPQLQSPEGVECAVRSTRCYAAALDRPLAVETPVNYLRSAPFEMSDGSFIARVAEQADCGILLDLHNLWANERNGRQPALETIAELPLERVWEVHVAGGEERNGFWIDGHCGAVPPPVLELAREVIPRLPNLSAVTLEIFPAYLPGLVPDGLRNEIEALREICALPAPRLSLETPPPVMPSTAAPSVADWEAALAAAILRRRVATDLGRALASDPAMLLYAELLEEFRASMVGAALGLTTRLLLLHLGKRGFRDLLASFWRREPPEMSGAAESLTFADCLRTERPDVPLLDEILSVEVAAIRAVMENQPQRVRLDCDIRLAIAELVENRIPTRPGSTEFEFVLDPPMAETGSQWTVSAPNLS